MKSFHIFHTGTKNTEIFGLIGYSNTKFSIEFCVLYAPMMGHDVVIDELMMIMHMDLDLEVPFYMIS